MHWSSMTLSVFGVAGEDCCPLLPLDGPATGPGVPAPFGGFVLLEIINVAEVCTQMKPPRLDNNR